MRRAPPRDLIYHRRRYIPEVIELCVRWYLTYRLSYRDLSAMMAERGVSVSHTTIMRWVRRYVPEFESRWARFQKQPIRPGGWTKPQYLFEDDGFTYIERSTGTGSPSTRCFARTERWIRRRSSFAKRSKSQGRGGRRRSISTETPPPIALCGCSGKRTHGGSL